MPDPILRQVPRGGTRAGTYASGSGSGMSQQGAGFGTPTARDAAAGVGSTGQAEAGNGTIASIAAGATVPLWGWRKCTDREGLGAIFYAAGTQPFRLNYFFTPDDGVSVEVGDQVSSATLVDVDGGTAGYVESASLVIPVGYVFRIEVFNPNATDMAFGYEYRLFERV